MQFPANSALDHTTASRRWFSAYSGMGQPAESTQTGNSDPLCLYVPGAGA